MRTKSLAVVRSLCSRGARNNDLTWHMMHERAPSSKNQGRVQKVIILCYTRPDAAMWTSLSLCPNSRTSRTRFSAIRL
jgi:hypothetical protein